MATEHNFPNITQWMGNQTIFITGVSGFLGKVLLYKLLKSCSDFNIVYVLIRSKKGKTTEERLAEMLSSEIFQEIKRESPELLDKVKGIAGDICQEHLGMEESDWQLLQKSVTLVFHIAASVRFDDSFKKATFTNLRSTKYALSLAKGMKNLKVFVHVSTAFTNCHLSKIPEKVIPTEFDPEQIIKIAENSDEHELEVLSRKILHSYPNTYIFTKNLAENFVHKQGCDIPVVIIRPSIVVSALKEPKPGWCDSISSIVALYGAGGKGILRVSFTDPNNSMDYIAVDACVNAMIVAAWYRSKCLPRREDASEKIVFNVTDVKTANDTLTKIFDKYQYICPLRNQLWRGFTVYSQTHWHFLLMTFLLHILPGLVLDEALKMNGKKPILMKIYRKLYVVSMALEPFVFETYAFDTKNFQMLKTVVPKKEKRTFNLESLFETTIEEYMRVASIGGRHLVGDPPEVYKEDVDRVYRLYWIDIICRLILLGLFVWILPLKSAFDWTVSRMNNFHEFLNAMDEN